MLGGDPERHVRTSSEVHVADSARELDQPICTELCEQCRRELIGHCRRGRAHRLGVLHDASLQRGEDRRVPPPGDLPSLGDIKSLGVRREVVQVEAEAAADLRGGCHHRERAQVLVQPVPLLGPAAELGHVLEDGRVVPHHLEALGHPPDLPAHNGLEQAALEAGHRGLGHSCGRAHVTLLRLLSVIDI